MHQIDYVVLRLLIILAFLEEDDWGWLCLEFEGRKCAWLLFSAEAVWKTVQSEAQKGVNND